MRLIEVLSPEFQDQMILRSMLSGFRMTSLFSQTEASKTILLRPAVSALAIKFIMHRDLWNLRPADFVPLLTAEESMCSGYLKVKRMDQYLRILIKISLCCCLSE